MPSIMTVSHSKYILKDHLFSILLIISKSIRIEDTIVAKFQNTEGSISVSSIWKLSSNSYYNQHYNWNFENITKIGEFSLIYWIAEKGFLTKVSAEVQSQWKITVVNPPIILSSYPNYIEIDSKFSFFNYKI